MNINVMNQQPYTNQTEMDIENTVKKADYDSLKQKYDNLKVEYENFLMKQNLSINETQILESKCFYNLIEQVDYNFNIIDEMKESYLNLKKKCDDNLKEVDIDFKKLEEKIYKANDNYKKRYEDLKLEYAIILNKLSEANKKLQEIELINEDHISFQNVYNAFDNDKKRINNELSNTIKALSEERTNRQKEIETNNILMDEITELKKELQKTSNSLPLKETNESKLNKIISDLNCNINTIKIDFKNLNKKYTKVKEELASEKQMNENLFRDIEANEQGINELNDQINTLRDQIVSENQKVAKLTKEKINDQRSIEKLSEERNLIIEKTNLLKMQLKENQNLLDISKQEITLLKSYLTNYIDKLNEKDREIAIITNDCISNEKKYKESLSLYEQEKHLINELQNSNSLLKGEIEVCRNNKDTSSNYTPDKIKIMEKEISVLKVGFFLLEKTILWNL